MMVFLIPINFIFFVGCIDQPAEPVESTISEPSPVLSKESPEKGGFEEQVVSMTEVLPGVTGLVPDGFVSEGEYPNSVEVSGGRLIVHWNNDAENLYMALEGRAEGFVAIGFDPSRSMKDADMIMGWVKYGDVTVLDLYATGTFGPHPLDEELGGTDDILQFDGRESDGITVIEFKRKMNTGDEWDKILLPGQTTNFIWSMSNQDVFAIKHNVAKGKSELTFEKA